MKIKLVHYLLVVIQFGILGFFVINHFIIPSNLISILLLADAVILGVWAVISMNLNTISALPDSRIHATLTKKGPYQWIRHPMYTSVLELAIALLVDYYSPLRLGLLLLLCLVLFLKMNIEEKILILKFPDYSDYISKTKRLIPWLY